MKIQSIADRKTFTVCIALLSTVLMTGVSSAAVLSDFEGGSADYQNGAQTIGKFRDTASGGSINISDNGAANDYLTFSGTATTVYDTSPGDASDVTRFLIGAGLTATVTIDMSVSTGAGRQQIYLGLFDPDATTPLGVAVNFNPRGGNASPNPEGISLKPISNLTGGFGANLAATASANIQSGTSTKLYRFELVFENNALNTGATVTGRLFDLSALEGTVGTQYVTDVVANIVYGTGTGEFDINPASSGLGIVISHERNGGDLLVDKLQMTVIPEPGTLALLALGGLLMLRRRSN